MGRANVISVDVVLREDGEGVGAIELKRQAVEVMEGRLRVSSVIDVANYRIDSEALSATLGTGSPISNNQIHKIKLDPHIWAWACPLCSSLVEITRSPETPLRRHSAPQPCSGAHLFG